MAHTDEKLQPHLDALTAAAMDLDFTKMAEVCIALLWTTAELRADFEELPALIEEHTDALQRAGNDFDSVVFADHVIALTSSLAQRHGTRDIQQQITKIFADVPVAARDLDSVKIASAFVAAIKVLLNPRNIPRRLPVVLDGKTIRIGRHFSVCFRRTLRIPEDGKDYPLPPGFSRFPICKVEDYADKVPAHWLDEGGFFIPMNQREALYLEFGGADWRPVVAKVGVGKINAVTGAPWDERIRKHKQDYVVVPDQKWLDGINSEDGRVRQFVAMPLGQGYTVEEQVTDESRFGGIQVVAFDSKVGIFSDSDPRLEKQGGGKNSNQQANAGGPSGDGKLSEEPMSEIVCRTALVQELAQHKQTLNELGVVVRDGTRSEAPRGIAYLTATNEIVYHISALLETLNDSSVTNRLGYLKATINEELIHAADKNLHADWPQNDVRALQSEDREVFEAVRDCYQHAENDADVAIEYVRILVQLGARQPITESFYKDTWKLELLLAAKPLREIAEGVARRIIAKLFPDISDLGDLSDALFAQPTTLLSQAIRDDYTDSADSLREMGIAPGGKIRQEIVEDYYGADTWDENCRGKIYIRIVNSVMFKLITGQDAPPSPISAKQYTEAGLPWFDYYDENAPAVLPSDILAGIKPIAALDRLKGQPAGNREALHVSPEQIRRIHTPSKEEQIKLLQKSALASFDGKRFELAKRLADRLMELDSADVLALRIRAECNLQFRKWIHAEQDARDCLTLDPDSAFTLRTRAKANLMLGHYAEAAKDASDSLDRHPGNDFALMVRGEAFLHLKRYPEAIADCSLVLTLNAGHDGALCIRAESYRMSGKYSEAIADATSALNIYSSSAYALSTRAESFRKAGNFFDARRDAEEALRLKPEDTFTKGILEKLPKAWRPKK